MESSSDSAASLNSLESNGNREIDTSQEQVDKIRTDEASQTARYNQLLTLMKKSDLFVKMIFQRMEENKKEADAKVERLMKKNESKKRKRSPEKPENRPSKRRRTKAGVVDVDEKQETPNNANTDTGENLKDGTELFTGGTLRDYQLEGQRWLNSLYENGISGILADEMGLGKTVQVIAAIARMIENEVTGPFLIVAPLSTLPNWSKEFARFTPLIPTVLYHGSIAERGDLRHLLHYRHKITDSIQTHPVLISSYDIVRRDAKRLRRFPWKTLVVDEGHRLKNHDCDLFKKLRLIESGYRLLLTGTPLQNNLSELWSLLNFILPEIFTNLQTFEEWFDSGSLTRSDGHQEIIAREKEKKVIGLMHQILTPFMLRRLKVDVDLTVPPKRETVIHAPLTKQQQKLYEQALDGSIAELRKKVAVDVNEQNTNETAELKEESTSDTAEEKGQSSSETTELEEQNLSETAELKENENVKLPKRRAASRVVNYSIFDAEDSENEDKFLTSLKALQVDDTAARETEKETKKETKKSRFEIHVKLMNTVMMLRRIINHTHMVEYPLDEDGEYMLDDRLINNSGKIQVLDKLLRMLREDGHKVLLFSQFTSMLDIIQDYCNHVGFKYSRLDGSMNLDERRDQLDWFSEEEDIFIFLLSTRAGGLGLNLIDADTVIFYDSDWNPQCDIQAQDRCHRIGQTKPVLVFRLVVPHTVEEKIVEYANRKRALERLIIHEGRFKKSLQSRQQWEDSKKLNLSSEELLRILTSKDYMAATKDVVVDENVLNNLLDRSDLWSQWNRDLNSRKKSKKA